MEKTYLRLTIHLKTLQEKAIMVVLLVEQQQKLLKKQTELMVLQKNWTIF